MKSPLQMMLSIALRNIAVFYGDIERLGCENRKYQIITLYGCRKPIPLIDSFNDNHSYML